MALARFTFASGGYDYVAGGFPYSAGVVAAPGYRLVRVRFDAVVPLVAGFARIADYLQARSRPLTALAAVELRSPAPFTLDGFRAFNRDYVEVLERWRIVRDGRNPVARSNVCPVHDRPPEPGFFAFTHTIPDPAAPAGTPDFVVAGSGEWPEDQPFPAAIVARGDLSARGLEAKAAYVLRTMQARCEALGCAWTSVAAAQVYCVHDIHPLVAARLAATGLLRHGLTWQICAPPVRELEFEMDVRRVTEERLLVADPTVAIDPSAATDATAATGPGAATDATAATGLGAATDVRGGAAVPTAPSPGSRSA
jgi:hypothetical protein